MWAEEVYTERGYRGYKDMWDIYKGTWDDIATWDTRIRGYRAYVGYKYTWGDT